MKPKQQQFVSGKQYEIKGASKLTRNIKYVAKFRLGKTEYLIFKPARRSTRTPATA